MDKCKLCDNSASLRDSHIIPKFVFRWLKSTTTSPLTRYFKKPDHYQQDGLKAKMLCHKCEATFNKWETTFANQIFWPFIKKHKNEYTYNEWLAKFITSVHWRFIAYDKGEGKPLPDTLKIKLNECEDYQKNIY